MSGAMPVWVTVHARRTDKVRVVFDRAAEQGERERDEACAGVGCRASSVAASSALSTLRAIAFDSKCKPCAGTLMPQKQRQFSRQAWGTQEGDVRMSVVLVQGLEAVRVWQHRVRCWGCLPRAAWRKLVAVLLVLCSWGVQAGSDLETALRTTLTQHPAVAGKRAEVQAREHELASEQGQQYPTFSAQASVNNNATQPASLRLRQPLWSFGRIEAGVAVAQAQLRAEQADLLRIQRDLIDQTAAAYAKVLSARARATRAQTNVTQLAQLRDQIKRREQGQLASRADVALAQARWVQAKAQLARFEGDEALAREELLALTQTPVQADAEVKEAYTQLPVLDVLTPEVLQASANVQAKERLIELARTRVQQERTATMPTFFVQADHYINTPTVTQKTVIGLGFESSFAGVGLVSKGRTLAAQSRLDAAVEDLRTTRSALTRQVASLWSRRVQQHQLLQELGASVRTLEALLASYQRQYQAGSKSWLDVINMQREHHEQRLQQVQAQSEWLNDSLKLSVMSGRLDAVATGAN